jgi:hypothetical protein
VTRLGCWRGVCVLVAMLGLPVAAWAQSDEIQVYDGGLAKVGQFNLTLHNNFTPSGIKTPAFPGGVTPHMSWNGVPEWALGVTKFFEAGLYLPLYTHDETLGWGLNGFKLRSLFAVPNADDRRFFYGANFEFSINQPRWDQKKFTSEVRPIVGWHLGRLDVIVNPIVDTSYDGWSKLEFVPSERVAWNPSEKFAIAVEEYADYGPISGFLPGGQQAHQLYGVIDYNFKALSIEGGVGIGLTSASDKVTLKLIVSYDFNKKG